LDFGADRRTQPEQLPIVLQVLLSQNQRLRALELLGRFVDMGGWAVLQALSVGIFPYLLKLLQSPAVDLRRILVFIWAKLLAFDKGCQVDLVKENGHKYFLNFISASGVPAEQKVMACFVISALCNDAYRPGQSACLQAGLVRVCLAMLRTEQSSLLQRWLCLTLGKCCDKYITAKFEALRDFLPTVHPPSDNSGDVDGLAGDSIAQLAGLLKVGEPRLRACALFAMGKTLGCGRTALQLRADGGGGGAGGGEPRAISMVIAAEDEVAFANRGHGAAALFVVRSAPLGRVDERLVPGMVLLSVGVQELDQLDNRQAEQTVRDALAHNQAAGMSRPPVQMTFAPSIGSAWVTKEVSVAFAMIHSLYDAEPSVRLELVVALGHLVEGHPSVFQAVVTAQHGHSHQNEKGEIETLAEVVALEDVDDGSGLSIDWLWDACVDIWSCIETLQQDPWPAVSACADRLIKHVAAAAGVAHSITSSQSDGALSNLAAGGSGVFGDGSSNLRKSVSMGFQRLSGLGGTSKPLGDEVVEPAPDPEPGLELPEPELEPESVKRDDDSGLFVECAARFQQPLLEANQLASANAAGEADVVDDDDDLASIARRRRRLRIARNIQAREAVGRRSRQERSKWQSKEQLAVFDNESGEGTHLLIFHPTEPLLVAADASDSLSVWQHETQQKLAVLPKAAGAVGSGGRVSALGFINPDEQPLLFTGTDDGAVRLWADLGGLVHGNAESPGLLTAWRAMSGLAAGARGAGLVLHWRQQDGQMLAAGDVPTIRVWDVERNICVADLPTSTLAGVTCLHSSAAGPALVAAGCGDGAIRQYDLRAAGGATATLAEHRSWVVRLCGQEQTAGEPQLVSAAYDGLVKVWDWRRPESVLTTDTETKDLSAFAVHPTAPLWAVRKARSHWRARALHVSNTLAWTRRWVQPPRPSRC
jgi:regulator-associated protein of mTOR